MDENVFLDRLKTFLSSNLQIFIILFLILLFWQVTPNYVSLANLSNILSLSSVLVISALGFMLIMEMGSIDLSVEGNMAVTGVVMAKLLTEANFGLGSVFVGMLLGAAFGFVNGFVHTRLKIPSFMASLGMNYILVGVCTVITKGQYIPITPVYMWLRNIAMGKIGGENGIIPYTVLIAAVVAVLIWFITEKIRYGRHVLVIGGDESIARELGINSTRVRIASYTIGGLLFGLSGCLLTLKLGAGDSYSSYGYTFETISACVIGGIAISGGVGKMNKAILGAVIITMVRAGNTFLNIPITIKDGVLGLVILIAVALTIDRERIGTIR